MERIKLVEDGLVRKASFRSITLHRCFIIHASRKTTAGIFLEELPVFWGHVFGSKGGIISITIVNYGEIIRTAFLIHFGTKASIG
jgi:hypothetical protein